MFAAISSLFLFTVSVPLYRQFGEHSFMPKGHWDCLCCFFFLFVFVFVLVCLL